MSSNRNFGGRVSDKFCPMLKRKVKKYHPIMKKRKKGYKQFAQKMCILTGLNGRGAFQVQDSGLTQVHRKKRETKLEWKEHFGVLIRE